MVEDFDWLQNPSIIVPAVEAIAIYENGVGDVVIRQQNHLLDEDSVLVVPRANIKALIDGLKPYIKKR